MGSWGNSEEVVDGKEGLRSPWQCGGGVWSSGSQPVAHDCRAQVGVASPLGHACESPWSLPKPTSPHIALHTPELAPVCLSDSSCRDRVLITENFSGGKVFTDRGFRA